ncbi:MAG: hypothetical protein WCV41_04925 [Patescibacteria group bacterium]
MIEKNSLPETLERLYGRDLAGFHFSTGYEVVAGGGPCLMPVIRTDSPERENVICTDEVTAKKVIGFVENSGMQRILILTTADSRYGYKIEMFCKSELASLLTPDEFATLPDGGRNSFAKKGE